MELSDFAMSAQKAPPVRLGQRYDAERFLPDPGNTVVCHLDLETPGGAAVLAARKRMMALPGAERLLFTPEDSLHMTVLRACWTRRRQPDAWPNFVDGGAPVAEVTAQMVERLQGFEGRGRLRYPWPRCAWRAGAARGDRGRQGGAVAWREALSAAFGIGSRPMTAIAIT